MSGPSRRLGHAPLAAALAVLLIVIAGGGWWLLATRLDPSRFRSEPNQ
jgi:hypothetical protein